MPDEPTKNLCRLEAKEAYRAILNSIVQSRTVGRVGGREAKNGDEEEKEKVTQ